MSLSAALVYCDFLDGSILKAAEKSREVIFRLRNTGASHWPLGVTLKPSEGTDRISCTAKALAESVACAQEADLRVSLDLSGANAGHHVLWFDLHCPEASFSSSGLSRVFIEFLLRPARRLVAQVFEFRPAPEQKYSFHCRGTRLSQKAEELLLIRAPFVSIDHRGG